MDPTPRSLILDLLSTLREGSMPVRALVRAAALFGLPENRLRVALARLRSAGRVERDERGRYRLGAAASAVQRQVTGWRRLDSAVRSWDGTWVAAHTGTPEADRASRERRRRALRYLGFRALAAGLEVRPDNLSGGVEGVRDRLVSLGLDAGVSVFRAERFDRSTEARARGLWPADEIERAHVESRRRIRESRARLEGAPVEAAMVETFLLGGDVLRQLTLDALLPDEILPADSRRALVREMREYDRFGRGCWRDFMREAGAVGGRAPAHDTAELAAAGGVA